MLKRLLISTILVFATSIATASAQNTNSSQTVRPRTTTNTQNTNKSSTDSQKGTSATDAQKSTDSPPSSTKAAAKPKGTAAEAPGSQSVIAAFNDLLNGIRHADVKAVSSVYWNSPRLLLFNNNGSVTKGWEQMRKNRENSYRDMKDVKLDCRDVSISMLGRDGAVVTCLWTQSQTFKGTPETATGRMTLVFKRVGKDWKAIHLHTSPDRPEPSRVPPSEQPTTTP